MLSQAIIMPTIYRLILTVMEMSNLHANFGHPIIFSATDSVAFMKVNGT